MRLRLSACALVAMVALAAVPNTVHADHSAPFVGKLTSTTTSAVPTPDGHLLIETVVDGRGTVIGKLTGFASYDVNLLDGSFTGVLTKVAANGDEIHESFIGQFNADFTESSGVFWINGGTGRFRHAEGVGLFHGEVTSPATIDIAFIGIISR